MCPNDSRWQKMLDAAEMDVAPSQDHLEAVRGQLGGLAVRATKRRRIRSHARLGVLTALCVSGVGLAATESGRALVRSLFVPIGESHVTQWTAPDGTVWSQMRNSQPYTPEEAQEVIKLHEEIDAIKQAGGGRLVGLLENAGMFGGGMTVYQIEYTLSTGETQRVGSGQPTEKQAENMALDEIRELRDAGAGEIIDEQPSELGMGRYVIRFTLSDGRIVDLTTVYPPSTRDQCRRMFAEMWQLKTAGQFEVLDPYRVPEVPEQGVWGILRYTLADGRVEVLSLAQFQ